MLNTLGSPMIYQERLKADVCFWYEWPAECLDHLPAKAWAMIRDRYLDDIERLHEMKESE